ncbi:unnamed protein product [uncultured bacterium]|nr:unnamed protein product [uncultured bacterium]
MTDNVDRTEMKIMHESNGWLVIESRENVPAGRYEVRSPDGRRYGIWESVERATRHLHETRARLDREIRHLQGA